MGSKFWATLLALLSSALTVATLTLGAAALRLAAGPVSLTSLAPTAESALTAALDEAAPGWSARLGDLALRRDPGEDGLGLRLIDLTLVRPDGAAALHAPEIAVAIDPFAAFGGALEITAVSLTGGRAAVRREQDGAFGFAVDREVGALEDGGPASTFTASVIPRRDAPAASAADDASAETTAEALARLIRVWSSVEGAPGAMGGLRRISVRDAAVSYEDVASGAVWRAPNARFDVSRPAVGGLRVALRAAIDFGDGDPPSPVSVLAERGPDAATGRLIARFERAPLAALARHSPALAALGQTRGFLSGESAATVAIDTGELLSASAALRGEGAQFAALRRVGRSPDASDVTRDPADPLALSAFVAAFDYEPADETVRLRDLKVLGDRLTAAARGAARLRRTADGALEAIEGELAVTRARLLDPALFEDPLDIVGGGFRFRLEPGAPAPTLIMRDLALRTDEITAAGAATILFAPPTGLGAADSVGGAMGARADVELTLSAFEAAALPRHWPLPAAPGGRAWVKRNIHGGWIEDARLIARIGGGVPPRPRVLGPEAEPNDDQPRLATPGAPRETIDFAFRFRDLESSYVGAMTPITGGVGSARIDADRFDLEVESGQVDLGEDGVISLDGSRFAIPDFAPRIPPSEIEIRSRGPLRAVLTLIDQEPLGFPRKLGLDPALVTGAVDGVTRLALPLAKDLKIEAVSVTVEAALSDVSLPVRQLGGAIVSTEDAALEADTAELRLSGEARVAGYEEHLISVAWRERFAPEDGEARTRLDLATTLTAAELYDLGAPETLSLEGAARLDGVLTAEDDRAPALRLDARLDRLGLADPVLGWRKPPGPAGRIEARGRFVEGGWRVDALSLRGPGLSADGTARLTATGGLRSLSLASLTVDERIDAAIDVTMDADDGIAIAARGARFDISEIVAPSRSAADAPQAENNADGASPAAPDAAADEHRRLSLDLAFDRMTLGAGAELQAVTLAAAQAATGRLYADLTAQAGSGALSATVRPIGETARRRYRLETDDLGQLLQASGQINAAERGAAVIEAEERADGAVEGALTARGLVVRDAPVLADILAIASVIGIFDLAGSGGITFSQIDAPFTFQHGALTLDELAAAGPSLGLTLKGKIDFRRDRLNLDGTVTPAYVLNALPGQVPIIGDLLTGGDGQGVLGVSFKMKGPFDEAKVSVDPLSAITPGPLRRLRRLFGG